ncbi:MAG TPA: sensor domain-containing protein [Thermomicrobiales bacterium]|nr:sensor domain-containing protein [Thermomicrobiales bacterium]
MTDTDTRTHHPSPLPPGTTRPNGSDDIQRMARTIADEPGSIFRVIRDLPGIRSWKILNDLVFLLLSGVLGIFWFVVAVVGFSVGGSLLIILVGFPILAGTIALLVWGAHLERARIRTFLGIDIPSPYRDMPQEGGRIRHGWRLLRTSAVWRDVAYLLLLFPIGLLEMSVALLPIQFFITPLITLFGGENNIIFWSIDSFGEGIVAVILGAILFVPLSILINLVATLHGEFARRLLTRSSAEILTERVEELTESRSAVMKAMHLERRRIERDLHDGAQQRLVSLAMDLGRARDRMESGDADGVRELLVHSHEESKVILKELRDLVRGIHPAVLSDRGLDAAISAIAGRSSIPVEVDVDLANRLPDEVEGTAYFFVVEALANIAKHNHAT